MGDHRVHKVLHRLQAGQAHVALPGVEDDVGGHEPLSVPDEVAVGAAGLAAGVVVLVPVQGDIVPGQVEGPPEHAQGGNGEVGDAAAELLLVGDGVQGGHELAVGVVDHNEVVLVGAAVEAVGPDHRRWPTLEDRGDDLLHGRPRVLLGAAGGLAVHEGHPLPALLGGLAGQDPQAAALGDLQGGVPQLLGARGPVRLPLVLGDGSDLGDRGVDGPGQVGNAQGAVGPQVEVLVVGGPRP